MRQGTVLQLRTDLLDDRMLAVDLISNNGVETIVIDGGEERVVPEQIEQSALSGSAFGLVELGMRLTTRRPVVCRDFFFEANAVNGTSATSALLTQAPVSSS